MDAIISLVLAFALSFGLGTLIARTTTGVPVWLLPSVRRFPQSVDGLAAMVCILLLILSFATLPWPFHPAGDRAWTGNPALLWALVEGAFLVPVFAGLLASSPLAARAVMREAQVNIAGRLPLWVVVGSSLWGSAGWTALEIVGRVILFAAGAVAVAAAAGLGPCEPDTSLSPAGAEEGLDESDRWLAQMARQMRAGLALALFVVGAVPEPEIVQPGIAAIIAIALFAVLIACLRYARRTLPHLTMHAIVQWCLWRTLPVVLGASVYLELVARWVRG